jgi:hypothetical protein
MYINKKVMSLGDYSEKIIKSEEFRELENGNLYNLQNMIDDYNKYYSIANGTIKSNTTY